MEAEVSVLEKEIAIEERLLGSHDEGGFWAHAARDCNRLRALYNSLGDCKARYGKSGDAEEHYFSSTGYKRREMIYLEKEMDFEGALALAKELSDEDRVVIYEQLAEVREFRDEDKRVQSLFNKLRKYRESEEKAKNSKKE